MKKLGIYPLENCGQPLEQQIERIAESGFDFVCASSFSQLAEEDLPALAARYGLSLENVHLDCDGMNAVWSPDSAGGEVIARLTDQILRASGFGVRKGIVHVTWGLTKPPLTELGLERLSQLVRTAESCGFVLCFENSVSMEHLVYVLDNLNSDSAVFCFDTGHHNAFAPESDVPFRYADRLAAVHLQDNDGARDLHLLPFDGTVDFRRIAPVLSHLECLALEPAGVRTVPFEKEEQISCLAVSREKGLLKRKNGCYTVYEDLSMKDYYARAYAAAVRLNGLIGCIPE